MIFPGPAEFGNGSAAGWCQPSLEKPLIGLLEERIGTARSLVPALCDGGAVISEAAPTG